MTAQPPSPRWRLRSIGALLGVGALLLLGALSACRDQAPESDGPQLEETTLTREAQVSNLIDRSVASGISATILPAEGHDDLVYVSLPAGVVAGGVSAEVRRKGDEAPVITKMQDGGFDPVAIVAEAGDSIQIVVKDGSGQVRLSTMVAVPRKRPPKVVRIWPRPGKPDMPVNSSMVAVFSEPIDRATVTSSTVRLLAGQREIPGQARVLDDGTSVAFTPNEPLAPEREYRFVLGPGIADLEGETLGEDVVVGFRTGTSTLGPPASIVVSPDSIILLVGATYQFSARVFDANGNLLLLPVTWRTSAPDALGISPTGLATALPTRYIDRIDWATGRIEASVGTLSASAFVVVVPQPVSIELLPTSHTLAVGDTLAFEVVTLASRALFNLRMLLPLTIDNSNSAAASISIPPLKAIEVSPFRTVRALAPGKTRITVRAGGISAAADITVTERPSVATVRIAPAVAEMMVPETLQLTAWLRDANGWHIQGTRPVSWSSSDLSVLTVNSSGSVTAVGNGTATVTATSEGVASVTSITVSAQPLPPTFVDVSAKGLATCGVTPARDAYCWGLFYEGGPKHLPVPTLLRGGLDLAAISPGGNSESPGYLCGQASAGETFCWSYVSGMPARFAAPLRFSDLSVSVSGYGCGVATEGSTYCWGRNTYGQLGDGTTDLRPHIPTAVSGGYTFASVTVGRDHSCAVTVTNVAYCWGANTVEDGGVSDDAPGGLGIGDSTTAIVLTPTRVAGGLSFVQLSASYSHTCGITTDGKAYCWGRNGSGELGDGTRTHRSAPVEVAGSQSFKEVSVGGSHSCAIATSGAAYCWGSNANGQLGLNAFELCPAFGSFCPQPMAVHGDLRFVRISLGATHSCGIATTGRMYCWGYNGAGQLGDGTKAPRGEPTLVTRPRD